MLLKRLMIFLAMSLLICLISFFPENAKTSESFEAIHLEEGVKAPFSGGLVPMWQINEAAKAKLALDICMEEKKNQVCPDVSSPMQMSDYFVSGGAGFVVGVLLAALAFGN